MEVQVATNLFCEEVSRIQFSNDMLDLNFVILNRIANCSVTDYYTTDSFRNETAIPINIVAVVIPDAGALLWMCMYKSPMTF